MKAVFSVDVDRLIAEFKVSGHPVPHSFEMGWVANPGRLPGKTGKFRAKPNPGLADWQATVREAAQKAMGHAKPFDGPVFLELQFTVKPRNGEPIGSPMTTPVKADGRKRDRTMPDVDNLHKAAQDALAGVVFANDVLACNIHAGGIFGESPGVKVRCWSLKQATTMVG